jgi:hypothetical protein
MRKWMRAHLKQARRFDRPDHGQTDGFLACASNLEQRPAIISLTARGTSNMASADWPSIDGWRRSVLLVSGTRESTKRCCGAGEFTTSIKMVADRETPPARYDHSTIGNKS